MGKVARDSSLCLRKQMAFMKYRKPKQKHHLIKSTKRNIVLKGTDAQHKQSLSTQIEGAIL